MPDHMMSFSIQKKISIFILSIVLLTGCIMGEQDLNDTLEDELELNSERIETQIPVQKPVYADVISVNVTGRQASFRFRSKL